MADSTDIITAQNEEKQPTPEEWRQFLLASCKKLHLPCQPTLTGPKGIQIDFCRGARVYLPSSLEGKFRLLLTDLDNYCTMYDGILDPGDFFVSKIHYFVRWGIQITEYPSGKPVLQHRFDAAGKDVLVKIPVETTGDNLAWFPAAVKFKNQHGCNLFVRVAKHIRPLLEECYPDIHFVSDDELENLSPYAVYTLAIFHEDEEMQESPNDYRTMPLHRYACPILGVPQDDEPPKIQIQDPEQRIKEPYVCIASQASGGVKFWNNPIGWETVVDFLKQSGYRVFDIDRYPLTGSIINWNRIPANAENLTGDIPLTERAAMIQRADFFVGLPSGLSWLAWCMKKDCVLISGFSEPWEEFPTPYRVFNPNVCHGCFNDVRHRFDHGDYTWCPKHKGTERHWECSRLIAPEKVIDTIKSMPVFQKRMELLKTKQEREN